MTTAWIANNFIKCERDGVNENNNDDNNNDNNNSTNGVVVVIAVLSVLLSFVLVIAIFRLIKKMKIQEEISRSQTKQERSNSQDQNVESFEMT